MVSLHKQLLRKPRHLPDNTYDTCAGKMSGLQLFTFYSSQGLMSTKSITIQGAREHNLKNHFR